MLSEDTLIALLKNQFPTHIGDDAAVLPTATAAEQWVITQDLLIEDVHFRRHYHDAESLAHKALQVNLSDLAAMGATPRFVLLGLSIPPSYHNTIMAFLQQFSAACKACQVELLGGDTTASKHGLFISVTALGLVNKTHIRYRHTARAGQSLCVAGPLGFAHLGLTALEQTKPHFDAFKQAFLYPHARLQEGLWFSQQPAVSAMMDLSDGLVVDAQKLASSSALAATLWAEALPIIPSFQAACAQLKLDPTRVQLTGGEDYGLLVAVDSAHLTQVCTDFNQQFNYPLQVVGQLHSGEGLQLTQHGEAIALPSNTFNHFKA